MHQACDVIAKKVSGATVFGGQLQAASVYKAF
jgi:hypothetical protein